MRIAFLILVFASLGLVGCNESSGGGLGPTTAATSALASGASLPLGAPCSGEISRYDSFVQDDLRTGNVEQKVYEQIQRELGRAATACSAGKGGEAHAIVAASKEKHGYRA